MRRGVGRRLLVRSLSSSLASHALPVASLDAKQSLEWSIARHDPSRALAAFETLHLEAGQDDQQLQQRLVLLLAKRGQPREIPRAAQILCHLLAQPGLKVDDTTQLAAIYTLESCLGLRRLEDALKVFEAARDKDIVVDLPAINAILKELVNAYRVDEAVAMVKSLTTQHEVRPTEQTFQVVLVALMKQKRSQDVVALIEHGRKNEVDFSPRTYDLLVNLSQEQYTTKNAARLDKLVEYINDALLVDGVSGEDFYSKSYQLMTLMRGCGQYWDDDDGDEDDDEVAFDDDNDTFDGDEFDDNDDEFDDEFD